MVTKEHHMLLRPYQADERMAFRNKVCCTQTGLGYDLASLGVKR
jgi:hypothetical protein